jgi:WhiB family redox-sensing transcriptional regulator
MTAAPVQSPTATAVRRSTGRTAPLPLDPAGTAELLGRILRGVPRLPGAACRDQPGVFGSDDEDDQAVAVAICQSCSALPACAAWVDSLPRSQRPNGVVAGQSTTEMEGSNHDT